MAALVCKKCGCKSFDLAQYESVVVLSPTMGLFGLRCPECGTHVASLRTIPAGLAPEIEEVAARLGCGMNGTRPGVD